MRRSGAIAELAPGVTQFVPQFRAGGGVGGGFNFFLSDRVSIAAKVAALATKTRERVTGSDFVGIADLGWSQLDPISAVVQWHLAGRGALRPYPGAGRGDTILRNVNEQVGADPTGLVVDGGIELSVARKWSLLGDARVICRWRRARVSRFPVRYPR